MKKYFLYPLRGIFNLVFIFLASTFFSICVYVVALIAFILPGKKLRHQGNRFLQRLPVYWIDTLSLAFRLTSFKKWDLQGPKIQHKKQPYLLISNHLSYVDIFILSYCFHRKSPPIRFFLKKQLLWMLPFAGLATWCLKYPFMARYTKDQIRKRPELKNKDMETTHKACQNFTRYPATIMNYVEGTRFTEEKRDKKNSSYKNLLPAKSPGIAIVINEMKHELAGIIDATICYKPPMISFWDFCCGNFDKIHCHYEVLPIDDALIGDFMKDRQFRRSFQAWLNTRWKLKDDKLEELKSS